MRQLRLVVVVTLLAAAVVAEATAAACMLMRSDISMDLSSPHELVVTARDAPADCPVTRCVAPTIAQVADLTTSVEVADPDQQGEPQEFVRPVSGAISPATPPPKPLLSNS